MKPHEPKPPRLTDVRPATLEPPAELRGRVGRFLTAAAHQLPLGPVAAASAALATVAARHVLLTAADNAKAADAHTGRYWHTRTRHMGVDQILDDAIVREWPELREISPGSRLVPPDRELPGAYLIESIFRIERWNEPRIGGQNIWVQTHLGAAPARPDDERAWRNAGSPRTWALDTGELTDYAGTTVFGTTVQLMHADDAEPVQEPPTAPSKTDRINWLAGRDVSVRDLAELPTDPDALRTEFMSRYTGEGSEGGPVSTTYWIYQSASNLLLEMPAPPAVRAATFAMLADLPEMRVIHDVVDPLGRPATAVAMRNPDVASGAYEDRLLIDPKTGAGLGSETYVLEPGADRPWAPAGLRLFWTAVEAAHWTDERPEPAPPDDRD